MTHARLARSTAGLGVATLLGLGLVGVAATPAHAVTVSDTTSLNDAIAANEPLIEIDGDFTLDDNILPIDYDVEIRGHGATIDADGWDAFEFTADATVSDLTVEDTYIAYYAEVGPGETLSFSNVSATDVNFGIDVDSIGEDATVTISGGTFTDIADSAIDLNDDHGTATIWISDVGIVNAFMGIDVEDVYGTSTVAITDATIRDSYYPIYYYGHGESSAIVTGTDITAGPNRNPGDGYGIYAALWEAARLEFAAGSIAGDPTADYFAYGLYILQEEDSSMTVTDSTISGNDTNVSINAGDPGTSFALTGSVVSDARNLNLSIGELAGTGLIDETTIADGGTASLYPGVFAFVFNGGELTISRSTVSGNSFGGLDIVLEDDDSSATVVNSTLSGNDGADGEAAVIEVYGDDVATSFALLHSTVTANTNVWSGIYADNVGTVTVSHSILSGNDVVAEELYLNENVEATVSYSLLGGTVIVGASTLTEGDGVVETSDPGVGPLADNGGPTLTHALTATSPALDAGDPDITGEPETDQRGEARVQGSAIDIGSVEIPAVLPATGAESGAGIVAAVMLLLVGAGLVGIRRTRTV